MYKVTINTDSYKKRRCSKKNWEPGTLNDFMAALNGWENTEPNLKSLRWRLETFASNCLTDVWDDDKKDYTEEYLAWKNNPKNTIKYFDNLCGFERTSEVQPYGFKQGYFSIDNVLEKVEKEGSAKVPFAWVYDVRQYLKNMDGCYMLIEKIS